MTAPGTGRMAADFGRLAGTWAGSNGFRLMPTDDLYDAPASAELSTAADGHVLVLRYTWVHSADGPQDGVMVVGSPEDERQVVTAAWGDSWHQKPPMLTLTGSLTERRLEVTADYGGGWRWAISLDGSRDDQLALMMQNIIPADRATTEVAAGPYPVMVAELGRAAAS